MTGRDRMVIMGIAVLVVLAGGWLLLVSPERKQAAQQEAQVATARQQLASAQAQANSARSAQADYTDDYASVVRLGKAVPPLQEVPSLIYELDQASNQRDVEFNSISSTGNAAASAASAAASAAGAASTSAGSTSGSAAASATVTPAAFTQMPFTFVFKGSFFGLAHLLAQIDSFANTTAPGASGSGAHSSTASEQTSPGTGVVKVNGRLLTIQSVNLTVESQGAGTGKSSGSSAGQLSATITATAYVLPASEGLTAGATPAGPAGTSAAAAATPSSSSSSSPASPAVIQGTP
jgi:hypothetical protein